MEVPVANTGLGIAPEDRKYGLAFIGGQGVGKTSGMARTIEIEDFVELALEYPERRVALGSRSHNYLMLTLARQWLSDRAANLPQASCGWMDKDELAVRKGSFRRHGREHVRMERPAGF